MKKLLAILCLLPALAAAEFTQWVKRPLSNVTASGSFTSPLLAPDGAVGTPSYAFTNSASTGLYRVPTTGRMVVTYQGVSVTAWGSAKQFFIPTAMLCWQNNADLDVAGSDACIARNASGVLEFNTSTGGTFIDLKFATGTASVALKSPIVDTATAIKLAIGATSTGTDIQGTTSNDSAAAGKYGEYISTTVASASAVSLSTTVTANMGSVALTVGDWDVECTAVHKLAATTTPTVLQTALSTTTATLPTVTTGATDYAVWRQVSAANGGDVTQHVGAHRISLSGNTTVFCVANDTFTTSTNAVYGTIRARRVR